MNKTIKSRINDLDIKMLNKCFNLIKPSAIWLILLGISIILTLLFSSLFGNPFDSYFNPPTYNLTVEPMLQPVFYDNEYHARFFIQNNGTAPLNGILASYRFESYMDENNRANLNENFIYEKGNRIYFDVPFGQNLDINCLYKAPVNVEIFKDKNGKLYQKCIEVNNTVCMWCNVTVVVSTEEISEIQKFNFIYPFSTGNLTSDNNEDCVTEDIIEDIGLTYHNTIIITAIDVSTPCLSGMDLDWCKKQGYI